MAVDSSIGVAENTNDLRIQRLEAELAEARAQQAATADVLQTIHQSEGDLPFVLDALASSVAKLCDTDVTIHRLEAGTLRIVAHCGTIPTPNGSSNSNKSLGKSSPTERFDTRK